MTKEDQQQFYAARREAGVQIDPATAKIVLSATQILDPYGIEDDLPPEADCVGRVIFARAPNGVWVSQYEMPRSTVDAIEARMDRELEEDKAWP
jgi:hypothetical protein